MNKPASLPHQTAQHNIMTINYGINSSNKNWRHTAISLKNCCFSKYTINLLTIAVLAAAHVEAATPTVDPKAAAVAAATARAAKTAEAKRMVSVNLENLKPYLPKLTEGDLLGCASAKLRELYYEAFRVQGLKMYEARAKANALVLDWN